MNRFDLAIEDNLPDLRTPSERRRDFRTSLGTLLLGAAVVLFLTRYNAQPYTVWSQGTNAPFRPWEEYLVVNLTGLLLLPMLFLYGFLRRDAGDFGFRVARPGAARVALLFYLLMLPLLFFAARRPEFQNYYPLQAQAAYSWRYLLYFELTYGLYMFCWEFFYRGFLLFGLARGWGGAIAIPVQAFAFGVMHIGKPLPEVFGSFFAGIALGWLAVRARSFLPCFALHWFISMTFDLLAIHGKPGGIL